MIDLRSDTVTHPTKEMLNAMMKAPLGDDVFGEDPTINALQEKAAQMFGKEAAIFAPSGTQTNLMAIMSHCERGDEYIVGQHAHTYKYEGGGAAVLGSVQPQPLDYEKSGMLPVEKIRSAIKPRDDHFAITKLICLENTYHGLAVPLNYYENVRELAIEFGLKMHLDGARLFNAIVKLGYTPLEIGNYFDSISVCLSKGLGAPVGSLLIGDKEFITRAHKWRKMLGGGMRQGGILAAAGIYALDNHINRLKEDHKKAEMLFSGFSEIKGLNVEYQQNQTNMVFIHLQSSEVEPLLNYMKKQDIILYPGTTLRLVTHLDVSMQDIKKVIDTFHSYYLD